MLSKVKHDFIGNLRKKTQILIDIKVRAFHKIRYSIIC
jgi:hypothetical protein